MDWEQIRAFIFHMRPAKSEQARLRQYSDILNELSPPAELADSTAKLLAAWLRI